ncbi:tetratricopeptide repeat protein [Hyphococcus sp.]|jgi:tetratricopeptide (TPR) repeat protein|uniref:tetratricopeptide repeat protein n=1 Tax=Hyphococcus sp. TaxID=2038636 RepID=UPI003D1287D7
MKSFCAAAMLSLAMFAGPSFAQTEEEASAKYAAQDWEGTAEAYGALLETDSDNASYLYYLARAQHELGQYDDAEKNYLKAQDNGFASRGSAQYHLARLYMSAGKKKKALAMLETLAETGGVPGGFVKNTAEFAPLAEDKKFIAVVDALTPCTDPEYRHFDFWLGTWDVTAAGASGPSATNNISSEHGGCVVLEQYNAGGFTGMSINFYDSNDKHWHQTWMANAGNALYLKGGLEDGAMVMSDKGLVESETINRITWTPNDDGSVRQHWETSTDDGVSWTTVFDGLYTKKAEDE